MRATWVVRLATLAALAPPAAAADTGYPLFFASFESVHQAAAGGGPEGATPGALRRVETEPRPLEVVDDLLTEWLGGCAAEAFLVVRDSQPFDPVDLTALRRLGEQSLTLGSFLTDYPLNLHELALDLAEHCHAEFVDVAVRSDEPVPPYVDSIPRVFYTEFSGPDDVDKSAVLEQIVRQIPSPRVTVVYLSTFAQARPAFAHVELDPRRAQWRGERPPARKPTIAPLRAPRARAKAPPPPAMANGTLGAALLALIAAVGLLLARQLTRGEPRPRTKPGKAAAAAGDAEAKADKSAAAAKPGAARGAERPRETGAVSSAREAAPTERRARNT